MLVVEDCSTYVVFGIKWKKSEFEILEVKFILAFCL